jgi:hypothetical protein
MIYATAGKYNSEVRLRPLVVIGVLLSGMAAGAQVGAPWREAPEYLRLLAPAGIRGNAYHAYVSPLDLETTLEGLAGDVALVRGPGAWEPRPVLPLDAFGQAGRYDRSAMTRVYGAHQPRVARGARMESGRVTESWTLISPYPDPTLRRLEAGTLLLVLRIP